MNPNKMWNLIADLIHSYAIAGEMDQALASLAQALESHPMWIPNALFDDRTERIRDNPRFKELTSLEQDDGPAHFNAAAVAFEHGEITCAVAWLAHAFDLAARDGSVPFLFEALESDDGIRPYLSHSKVTALLEKYSS